MEPRNKRVLSPAQLALIEEDKNSSQAVYFIDCQTDDSSVVEQQIEEGFASIRERADDADMVIVNTIYSQSTYTVGVLGHLCVTIIVMWAKREDMERMALQQRLAGQQGPVRGAR